MDPSTTTSTATTTGVMENQPLLKTLDAPILHEKKLQLCYNTSAVPASQAPPPPPSSHHETYSVPSRIWSLAKEKHGSLMIQLLAHAGMFISQIFYALLFIVTKDALTSINPYIFATIRVMIGTTVVFGMSVASERRLVLPPTRTSIVLLILLGVFGVAINQSLLPLAEQKTSAINVGLLQPFIPVFATFLAIVFRMERAHWLKFLGILVSIGGVMLMLNVAHLDLAGDNTIGMIYVIIMCASIALSIVISKKILSDHMSSATAVTFYGFFYGTVVIASIGAFHLEQFHPLHMPFWPSWAALLYAGIVPTGVTYTIQTWALHHLSPSIVASYVVVQPFATAILSFFLLGETVSWNQIVGGLLAVLGLVCVSVAKRYDEKRKASQDELLITTSGMEQEAQNHDDHRTTTATTKHPHIHGAMANTYRSDTGVCPGSHDAPWYSTTNEAEPTLSIQQPSADENIHYHNV